jgi:hypothetical protein
VVERILGKAEVGSSILPGGTSFFKENKSLITGLFLLLLSRMECLANPPDKVGGLCGDF